VTATAVGRPPAEHDVGAVNVLLVDDRPENLLALEAILEPLGLTMVRAHSGAEALKSVLQHDFAAILLDVQMPGMNGFETAQIIKSRERSRAIPIIFLTAINKEEAYVFKGYEVGAVDYIFKPFQPDVLRSKVAVFVDLHRKQAQIKRQEEQIREAERRVLELRHRAELAESEARTAAIVGSAMDAIVTFGGDRRITLYTAAAERMFGRPAAEMIDRLVGELFPPGVRDEYVGRMCGPAARGDGRIDEDGAGDTRGGAAGPDPASPRIESFTGVRPNGEEFPIEASVSALALADGAVYTLIARDVSERKRAEEALRTQAVSLANTTAELKAAYEELQHRQAQLEEAMRARNRFYASMSHELRTPINAIIGYNTLLLDHIYGPLNERQTQGLQRTHKAAKHLLELVNDVLDLSKIEAGKIELSLQPVGFPALVEDLFVTVRPLADEHGSELALELHGEPTTVITDPRRVRQILLNLLSNAIKFGAGKPINVDCRVVEGGVEIDVRDAGPGIDAADLPRIFDEFVQLAHTPQQVAGTGLGLPISKRLALLLGGALEAESTPGAGSVFRLRLPKSAEGGLEDRIGAAHEGGAAARAAGHPVEAASHRG
jgi:signal transduction histidine kinase/CheY-like chemotaxis protein